MAWTEESAANNIYDYDVGAQTVWDAGATLWDVSDNVVGTHWDYTQFSTSWSEESGI